MFPWLFCEHRSCQRCAAQRQSWRHFMKILQREQREIWFQARRRSVLCLCVCGVSLTGASQIHPDAITAHWVFAISIMGRKHLTDCNADWEIKAEVNEEHALGLQQFINLSRVMHPLSACWQHIHTLCPPPPFFFFKCTTMFASALETEDNYCTESAQSRCSKCGYSLEQFILITIDNKHAFKGLVEPF